MRVTSGPSVCLMRDARKMLNYSRCYCDSVDLKLGLSDTLCQFNDGSKALAKLLEPFRRLDQVLKSRY